MEAVLTTVGGAVLSASFHSLFDKLGSSDLLKSVGDEGQEVVEIVGEWQTKLKQIGLVIDHAEEKQFFEPLVKMWVSKLRNLAYDAADILDEFSTDRSRRCKSEDEQSSLSASTSKLRRFIPSCCARLNLGTSAKFNAEMIARIRSTTERLDKIIKEKDDLHFVVHDARKSKAIRATTSLVNEAQIYGREEDMKTVIEIMMKAGATDAKPSVIPIVGMGGVGKTTLAQLIFNDTSLEFDLKSWVSVGEDFDVLRITKIILEPKNEDENKDLNWHQLKLIEKLSRNKFLIVLDDLWPHNYLDWKCLYDSLTAGKHGSTLIITTRSQDVSRMMGTVPAYPLDKLSYDDCMLVFTRHALGAKNFDEHMELKEIGTSIVNRCQGLPLAAKAIGGLLCGKSDPDAWMDVLRSEIWKEGRSNILPALRLSYFHLPSHLKQCFAYCAIFPKGYEFDENELVLLWMAEGFLYQAESKKPMKALGHEYFHDLVSRSFFQRSDSNESQYVMHDLMNDLARQVSGEICFQLGHNLEDAKPYATVRHSSFTRHEFDTWQKFEVFLKMKSLRTFLALPIMVDYQYHHLTGKVLYALVPELKCLRALSLAGYNFEELPSSIGALKHLRYLNLSQAPIRRLPESVVDLLNLQTLRLCGCNELTSLPLGICNLKNLQCLDVRDTDQLQEMPPQIGNLRNLHTLTKFIVGKENGLKLTELKKLCHLQGRLDVEGLENVVDIRNADCGYLKEKDGIVKLKLKWDSDFSGSRNPRGEVEVLNSLRPHHQNLSSLSISGYGGTVLPSWIGDPRYSKMVKLNLRDCRKVTSLPPLGQLAALRELSIEGMNGVKEVGVELYGDGTCFASLETLSIRRMEEWEKWCFSDDVNEVRFPELRELRIVNCRKLVGKLPCCLPTLQKLHVERCQRTLVKNMYNLTSLTMLKMIHIAGLVSFDEAHIEELAALQDLKIWGCEELKYLWKDETNLDKLASLKSVEIWNCEQMVSLVDGEEGLLPCNLQVLKVNICNNLEIIFKCCNLQLECFEISGVRSIKWSPNVEFPDSLKSLRIRSCNWATELMESLSRNLDYPNGFSRLTQLSIENYNHSLPSSLQNLISLQSLSIDSCKNLRSPLNWMQNLTSLQSLRIEFCENLRSLPDLTSLQSLYIYWCENLSSLPNLTSLRSLSIECCENLRSLPNLASLETLSIEGCGGLESFPDGGLPPNLTDFEVNSCKNLKQPMSEWGLDRLNSLTCLTIEGTIPSLEMLDSFPDDNMRLPTSLKDLYISDFKNLKSISNVRLGLPNLTSLFIKNCPNLRSLPQEIGFPSTLESLTIYSCPLVKERDFRSLIFQIPSVQINKAL